MYSVTHVWQGWIDLAGRGRRSFYDWRDGMSPIGRLCLMFAAAAGIGLCSRVAIPLPFTPVPLSLQTFGVAAAAVTMGRGWGGASVATYAACIALGAPWTVSGLGGLAVFAGPTAGYLLGFVLEGAALNLFAANPARCRWFPMWGAIFVCDAVFVLTPGTLWLWGWLESAGQPVTLMDAAAKGFFPFIFADIVKSGLTAAIVGWLGRQGH
ncbi:MAG: biotin transporter BioY [Desulfovibrio sp.]|jgi:biotin transport system substrate-specific component|nr:biotin transporter BioY [Desulfovibrio sp.]